jgi:hypothetical protein
VEITQAVQNLDNSVPLVAGKETWARIYVAPVTPTTPQTVNATLDVTLNGKTTHLTGKAAVKVADVNDWSARKAWGGSINIKIPDELTKAGSPTFTVTGITDQYGKTGVYGCYNGCENNLTVTFLDQPAVIVRAFGMKYNNAPAGKPIEYLAPRTVDYNALKSWLGRAYPTASVTYSTRVIHLKNGSALATTADVSSGVDVNCNTADAQLAAIRAQDVDSGTDSHTHYMGLVSTEGAYLRGCANGIPQTPDRSTSTNWVAAK